ncbi:GDSL-type esterase/lipase family protein [Rhodococcus maanshanensis]|uniref:GDSL-type esterase/lipase family protein n=1 Tax=Rhodococcus maanshanensis TaxID=183556 RepID=UPI0022B35CB0|nr:GDSL-type esterase/lipase family protein [Rhodococcus maanshanensis]MCZ4556271.1 GDSL-type esterase/lipase family protein [Rhodococcus maanshanensis]
MISTPFTADIVRGVAELTTTPRGVALHRLPAWVREQFPDSQLLAMEGQSSGARLQFETEATCLELVTHPTRVAYRGADRPRGRIDVFVDGVLHTSDALVGGDRIEIDLQTEESSAHGGPSHTTTVVGLAAGSKRIEVWLPHNEALELAELRSDAPVNADVRPRPLWVHHGSSISHGSNALAPSEIWPSVAARFADVELRNLGLGGSAMVDPFLARVIRDAPADAISVKLGINVVNLDAMRLRAFVPAVNGFLDTIRDGHPNTPILLVSPIFCAIHENTPGPGAFDPATLGTDNVQFVATGTPGDTAQGRLTLEVIRDALRSLVERRAADANLHYLDGTELYGPEDAERLPLPDGLHPSTEAHQLIGRRFADYAFAGSAPFSASRAA